MKISTKLFNTTYNLFLPLLCTFELTKHCNLSCCHCYIPPHQRHSSKEKELSTVDEVAYKHSIWDERAKIYRMLSQASRVLAQRTGLLSLVATNAGELYYAGMYHLLEDAGLVEKSISKLIYISSTFNFFKSLA